MQIDEKVKLLQNPQDEPQQISTIIQKETLEVELERQLAEIDSKFAKTVQILEQTYDEYMKQIAPHPKFLPLRINVVFASKADKKVNNVMVKPFDTMNHLVKQLHEVFTQRGDPIIKWNLVQTKFTIKGPLFEQMPANHHIVDSEEKKDGEIRQEQSLTKSSLVEDLDAPFQAFKMAQGSTIEIVAEKDQLTFNSEKPLQCVTLTFKKGEKQPTNYFSCKSCNKNWICEQCKDGCHAGHTLLPHVMNHQAASAICYCVKYKLCKIPNIKN